MFNYSLVKISSFSGTFIDIFYSYSFLLVLFVRVFVFGLLSVFYRSGFIYSDYLDDSYVELYWTFIPGLILFFLSVPSFISLYYQDKLSLIVNDNFKILGNQWYWSFSSNNYFFDCYIHSLKSGLWRILSVQDSFFLVSNFIYRILFTSRDVIHSFRIPEFGLKVDCLKGRSSWSYLFPLSPGVYYGQCSEVCGLNHSFMPSSLEVISCTRF